MLPLGQLKNAHTVYRLSRRTHSMRIDIWAMSALIPLLIQRVTACLRSDVRTHLPRSPFDVTRYRTDTVPAPVRTSAAVQMSVVTIRQPPAAAPPDTFAQFRVAVGVGVL